MKRYLPKLNKRVKTGGPNGKYYLAHGSLLPSPPPRYPWIEEFEKWLPDVDPRRIRLISSQGDINEIDAEKVDVVVLSYGLFRSVRLVV